MANVHEPSDYLRDRHASVSAPRHVLDDVVRRATGSAIDELERIVRGYVNETYRVRTTSGLEVSVRLRRFGAEERMVEWEAWAMERARAAGAPVAEVLLAEQLHIDGTEVPVPVMVLTWLPGTPLSRVEGRLSGSQLWRVFVEMGAVFAAINSVPVDGFWVPEDTDDWSDATWDRIAGGYPNAVRSWRADAYAGGVTVEEFERTLELVQWTADEFPCEQAVLCHNDMSPEHVIVDAEFRIVGVIDFGNWCGGSDVGDLGYMHYARHDLALEPFLEGYGSPHSSDDTFLTRVRLQALGQAIGHLAHEVREADWEQVAISARTLRSLLDTLDDG